MRRTIASLLVPLALGAVVVVPGPPAAADTAGPAVTGRVSVADGGGQGPTGVKGDLFVLSGDGRFAAFTTADALVASDTNGFADAYLRDRTGGTTRRVSLRDDDTQIAYPSWVCGMSANGRFIAFTSSGVDLPNDAGTQVYLRDRGKGTTTLISQSTGGDPSLASNGESGIDVGPCDVSDDGRYVAFLSYAENLAGGDENGLNIDVFRRDTLDESTQRVNVSTGGLGANGGTDHLSMSADGATIAFDSAATNLVAADSNNKTDVFVRLMGTSQTLRVSTTTGGAQLTKESTYPSISSDGNRVAFLSAATNLVANDTNAKDDVFVRDRTANTITRASLMPDGSQATGNATDPDLSGDGTVATFTLYDPVATAADPNGDDDVFRRDLDTATTTAVSVTPAGVTGNDQSFPSRLSADGDAIAFCSDASDLVRNDTNGHTDLFVRDIGLDITPFLSIEAFIRQQFVDFAGRQPTAGELATWKDRFTWGERSPDELVDDLAHASTWAGKRAPLTRLYWAFFHRVPDTGGMAFWTGQLTGGKTLAQIAKAFSGSSEFQNTYGSLSNQAFVTLIYQNIFQRNPDPGGLAYWTGRLDAKAKTRGDVMVAFSESSEGKRVLAPQVDTVLLFLGLWAKMPTQNELLEGADLLQAGEPPERIAWYARHYAPYASRVTVGP